MKFVHFIIAAAIVAGIFLISEDPFFIAGGSDVSEEIVMLSRGIRLAAAVFLILCLAALISRPSFVSLLLVAIGVAAILLAHNTVRVSSKSYEVVQSVALIPVTRIPFVEGEGDIIDDIFVGFGPLALPENTLRETLTGIKRKQAGSEK